MLDADVNEHCTGTYASHQYYRLSWHNWESSTNQDSMTCINNIQNHSHSVNYNNNTLVASNNYYIHIMLFVNAHAYIGTYYNQIDMISWHN